MNFSGISNQTPMGQLLRLPFRLIPPNSRLPILQGRLRGKRWIAGSSNHGCWLGSYEYRKRILFENTVTEEACVFDIGAHVGFYTLLASVLVGPRGRVFAFEPLPSNMSYLTEHLLMNKISNVKTFEVAVSDHEGEERFNPATHRSMGHLSLDGALPVRCISLDQMHARGKVSPPDFIKIDVEGAEFAVLCGARGLLSLSRPVIFLSTHGAEVHRHCCDFLRGMGYALAPIEGDSVENSAELLARRA